MPPKQLAIGNKLEHLSGLRITSAANPVPGAFERGVMTKWQFVIAAIGRAGITRKDLLASAPWLDTQILAKVVAHAGKDRPTSEREGFYGFRTGKGAYALNAKGLATLDEMELPAAQADAEVAKLKAAASAKIKAKNAAAKERIAGAANMTLTSAQQRQIVDDPKARYTVLKALAESPNTEGEVLARLLCLFPETVVNNIGFMLYQMSGPSSEHVSQAIKDGPRAGFYDRRWPASQLTPKVISTCAALGEVNGAADALMYRAPKGHEVEYFERLVAGLGPGGYAAMGTLGVHMCSGAYRAAIEYGAYGDRPQLNGFADAMARIIGPGMSDGTGVGVAAVLQPRYMLETMSEQEVIDKLQAAIDRGHTTADAIRARSDFAHYNAARFRPGSVVRDPAEVRVLDALK